MEYIDLKKLTLDELVGVVNLYPWFGGARKELCVRMSRMGDSVWGLEQYADADYQAELGESDGTYLMLDALHTGLGGDTGWSKNIHPEYWIGKGIYTYRFMLEMK